jgi:hypothetical protein
MLDLIEWLDYNFCVEAALMGIALQAKASLHESENLTHDHKPY